MKFFTHDWWMSGDDYTVFERYRTSLNRIQEHVPPGLWWLQHWSRLHDAKLKSARLDTNTRNLTMMLVGVRDPSGNDLNPRRFTLRYSGVQKWDFEIGGGLALPLGSGIGDLGYDEVDLTEEGVLEHRMLFSSGSEFQIQFKGFELEWEDIEFVEEESS